MRPGLTPPGPGLPPLRAAGDIRPPGGGVPGGARGPDVERASPALAPGFTGARRERRVTHERNRGRDRGGARGAEAAAGHPVMPSW
ncbi:hypothetical protein GCM10010106_08130 [Thermopolyspora flexuosa]|nr:hypothetical protein GCM10010106_08130 [Thermopolyspora flexuosa]